jgi:hypothetical protein
MSWGSPQGKDLLAQFTEKVRWTFFLERVDRQNELNQGAEAAHLDNELLKLPSERPAH